MSCGHDSSTKYVTAPERVEAVLAACKRCFIDIKKQNGDCAREITSPHNQCFVPPPETRDLVEREKNGHTLAGNAAAGRSAKSYECPQIKIDVLCKNRRTPQNQVGPLGGGVGVGCNLASDKIQQKVLTMMAQLVATDVPVRIYPLFPSI